MTTTVPAATTSTGWDAFRVLLEQQRETCTRQRELLRVETATAVPDPVALSRSARILQTIADIDAALARIAAGTYGECVHCGFAIPTERLELRPFAAGCVRCEQRHT